MLFWKLGLGTGRQGEKDEAGRRRAKALALALEEVAAACSVCRWWLSMGDDDDDAVVGRLSSPMGPGWPRESRASSAVLRGKSGVSSKSAPKCAVCSLMVVCRDRCVKGVSSSQPKTHADAAKARYTPTRRWVYDQHGMRERKTTCIAVQRSIAARGRKAAWVPPGWCREQPGHWR